MKKVLFAVMAGVPLLLFDLVMAVVRIGAGPGVRAGCSICPPPRHP